MEKLTSLIVDDEEKAVNLLYKLLEATKEFSRIECAQSADTAKQRLEGFKPDMIFLDIRMPHRDGFALLKEVEFEKTTEVVFVTAHDEYALQAIRQHAFGYLLKPVNRQELNSVIRDYKEKAGNPALVNRLSALLENFFNRSKIRISTRTGFFFIDTDNILYCAADGNYTSIHTGNKQHVCSLQLSKVQDLLPANGFDRIGRSLVVNGKYISHVDRKSRTLTFEKEGAVYTLSLSRTQIRELEEKQQ